MTDPTLAILGAILCLAAIANVITEQRRHNDHHRWCAGVARADGVVSRMGRREWLSRNEPTSDDSVAVVPIVRFNVGGIEYEFDAPDAPRKIGAPVQVAYDPDLPSTARAVDRTRKLGCAFLFAAAGLFLIARGVF